MNRISDDILFRIPMFSEENFPLYHSLKENIYSPKWNTNCGDRLTFDDKEILVKFQNELEERLNSTSSKEKVLNWISKRKQHIPFFRERLRLLDIENEFELIELMNRNDLVKNLVDIVPDDSNFSRLVVNPTSGTTGHSISCPNHPVSVGTYNYFILYTLKKHKINIELSNSKVATMLICSQDKTIEYSTVLPILNGAGYAKINLNPNSWKNINDFNHFYETFQPEFLCGDPISFYHLSQKSLKYKPKVLLSTSLKLNNNLANYLINIFGCPIIDFYSLNETGPIAYSCPIDFNKKHILPNDIYVEITDNEGKPLGEGEKGNIVVTGGRNPFLPLLRYNTGDKGRIHFSKCECGEVQPYLYDCDFRSPVLFMNSKNKIINPIDISRILRSLDIKRHKMYQSKNSNIDLHIIPGAMYSDSIDRKSLKNLLNQLFEENLEIQINDYDEINFPENETNSVYFNENNPMDLI
jgi:phenylacetate-CoA ligase